MSPANRLQTLIHQNILPENNFFVPILERPIPTMSHIVEIQTEIRDGAALSAACQRLNLPEPVHEAAKLYSTEATGHVVRLPEWRYPVVCDLAAGSLAYDNYGGRWGEQRHLDSLLQAYAVERAKLEARKAGYSTLERPLEDGSIRLTINLGGVS